MWVFWVVDFEIVVIMSAVNVFCCRMGDESCKDVNEMCSPIICPRTEKGRKQRSLCIKSELDVSPPRTSSVCTGDTPRVCVGKGEKLRSKQEKPPCFPRLLHVFRTYHAAFLRNVPLYGRKTGNAGRKPGEKGNTAQTARRTAPVHLNKPAGKDKKKAKPAQWQALLRKRRGEVARSGSERAHG